MIVSADNVIPLEPPVDLRNGQFVYSYTLTTVGAYTIFVVSAAPPQANLTGSPAPITVTIGTTRRPDAPTCTPANRGEGSGSVVSAPVDGTGSYILPGQVYTEAEALRRTLFQIQAADAFGNLYTVGGAQVR